MKRMETCLAVFSILFFIFVSVIYAQFDTEIIATVITNPAANTDCKPDAFTIGSKLEWINCFIELSGVDVSEIDLSTVKMRLGSEEVLADQFFSNVDDFDMDGEKDLQVRFDRDAVEIDLFGSPSSTTSFEVEVIGEAKGFPFIGKDSILVVVPENRFVRYIQFNSSTIVKGKVKVLGEINMTQFVLSDTRFNGFFTQAGNNLLGSSNLFIEGHILVPRTVNFFFFTFTFNERQNIVGLAKFSKYLDCFINNTDRIFCEGEGSLLVRNKKIGTTSEFELPTLRFDLIDGKVLIEGGDIWNDLLSASDIGINRIRSRLL